jgi:hypothetical protein
VNSVEIVGVDRSAPRIRRAIAQFERRAVAPERVAERIIDGIEKDRFLVFTSRDIQILHWFQRKFALPYEMVMRQANDRMVSIADPRDSSG